MFCSRPHLGRGRQIVDEQKVHSSVMSLDDYTPCALLPIGKQLYNLQDYDPFERARSILALLLTEDENGSKRVDDPETIKSLSTELLDCIDNSMFGL
jgi:hypothetical protein